MSRADDLLENLPEGIPQIVESNSFFTIDPVTRIMSNGTGLSNVIMQGDHESVTYTFELPRYIDGHDMLQCNKVLVHWNNIGKPTGDEAEEIEEVAEVKEIYGLRINPDDDSTVICSWTISRNSTQLIGILSFLVEYKRVENGKDIYEWHTDIYSDVEIRSGRNNGEQSIIDYTDILTQWETRIFGSGDSVIADIASAGEVQKDAIAAKGEVTLASIPTDYTETHNMAWSATRTRASAIVVAAEGESIVVKDCSNDYLRGLRVFGKSTQKTTTGKNLLKNTTYTQGGAGVTFTVNEDTTITVDGTATDIAYIPIGITLEPDTDYILSGCPSGGSSTSYSAYMIDKSTFNKMYHDYGESVRFNTGNETNWEARIRVAPGTTLSNKIFKLMIRHASIEDSSWEPYTGGVASPSPEWQQDLKSVTDPLVRLYGKNLINFEAIEKSANTSLEISDDGYMITLTGGATYPYTSSHIMLDVEQYRGRTVIFKQESVATTVESGRGCAQLAVKTPVKTTYLALSEATPRIEVVIP